MAVPSFNKDSPSINMESFFEVPSSLRIAIVATGSVAEIKNPKSNEAVQSNLSSSIMMYFMTTAVRQEHTTSIGPAKIRMLINCFLKMNQSQLNAESKMRAGRNNRRTRLGSMELNVSAASPKLPRYS